MILFGLSCPAYAEDAAETRADLNDGYFLLHHLSDDESDLPMLLAIKHAPPEIKDYAGQIARTANATLSALDRFQDADRDITMDHNPLPKIEREVRASIQADKQHQLLFGTSNAEFVRALLVSQIEAATYAGHLGKVLADHETNPQRAKKLRHLSSEWLARRDDAFRLLRNY